MLFETNWNCKTKYNMCFTKSRSNVLQTRTLKGTVHIVGNVVWKCSEHLENKHVILYMHILTFRNDSLELEVNF